MVREQDFETVKAHYSAKGMTCGGAILLMPPFLCSELHKKTGNRDPEMQQFKKGNQWHIGM